MPSRLINTARYGFIILACILGNILYLNWDVLPVDYPDSASYTTAAQEIKIGDWPDLSSRTPTYPLFLALFSRGEDFDDSVYASLVLNALGAAALLRFLDQISARRVLNLLAVIFVFLDFGIVNYQNTLLVEAIASPLLLFSLICNLLLVNGKRFSKRNLFLLLLTDFLLMFLKPHFLLLGLVFKVFLLLGSRLYPTVLDQSLRRTVLLTLLVNVGFVAALPSYNYLKSGKFQISEIGTINTFGAALYMGYLDPNPAYKDAPQVVRDLMAIYEKYEKPRSPWTMSRLVIQERLADDPLAVFSAANRYLYPHNLNTYLITKGKLLITNFTISREYYSPLPDWLKKNSLYKMLDQYYGYMNRLKLVGFLLTTALFLYFLRQENIKAVPVGMALIAVAYTIFTMSIFSYSEFARLRQPVDPLLNLFVILPLLYVQPS